MLPRTESASSQASQYTEVEDVRRSGYQARLSPVPERARFKVYVYVVSDLPDRTRNKGPGHV